MACNSKTDKRAIARVVFTATGERRPAKVGEWYQYEDGAFWCRVAEASLTDLDIFTRKVHYAPAPPLNEAGQAEPPTVDLREIANRRRAAAGRLSVELGEIDRQLWDAVVDRLEAMRRDIGALERWVKGFETP